MGSEDVFLSLGSNLGDRSALLQEAETALGRAGFETLSRSSVYETEPVGGPAQGEYLNRVLGGRTALEPRALLEACLGVEKTAGRVRAERNGPRTLDVDLLLFGAQVRSEPSLVVPHPRMHERRFVLVPLAEIAPRLVHPVLELTIAELLARCPDHSRVERRA
jgi:2-amino-4-hydroxy-6-hydroxymethyldihydropteridine diphosphokinase